MIINVYSCKTINVDCMTHRKFKPTCKMHGRDRIEIFKIIELNYFVTYLYQWAIV